MLQRYWFGDIDEDGYCRAAGTDPAALAERVSSLSTDMESYTPINWEVARDCGVVRTRDEYVALLRSVCMILARQKIARSYQERDVALLQMVRMLDEVDNVINLLSERAAEWYQVTDPSFSRKYRSLPAKKMLDMIRRGADGGLAEVAAEIERLTEVRRRLMREVSAMADEVMPNVSALIGGLVAARLLSRAGGLGRGASRACQDAGKHHTGARLGAGALFAPPGRVAAAKTRYNLSAPPGSQRPKRGEGAGGPGACGETRHRGQARPLPG